MADDREFWDQLIRERGPRAFDTYESHASSLAKAQREVDTFLVSHMHGVTRGSILEIGCGRGRMTQVLADLFETVVALDISTEATSRCRALVGASNVLVVVGDHRTVAAMPTSSFDVVFSYATFQHISSGTALRSYVASAARLVNPKGIALLQLRQPGWKARIVDFVAFARRAHSHKTWSRSWRGQVLDEKETERIVLSTRPGATVSTFQSAFVAGTPRHLWTEIRP
jgi:cyclopropane fatty-acyl-phospholipid synthase-like methyltransferase